MLKGVRRGGVKTERKLQMAHTKKTNNTNSKLGKFARESKAARESCGLTREQAGELLAVTGRMIANYETGVNPWPTDVVVRMAEAYRNPWLLPMFCQTECPIGKHCPHIEIGTGVAENLLEMHLYDSGNMDHTIRDLHDVLKDGVIEPEEQAVYERSTAELLKRDAQLRQLYYSSQCVAAQSGR